MARDQELSPAQIQQANMAGVWADRPGLGGEYPKMLFKKGIPGPADHVLATDANGATEPLPVDGHKDIVTRVVDDAEAEIMAADEGWTDSIAKALATKAKAVA